MISIKREDRDSLRFLWSKSVEDDVSKVVQLYRFCRLVFGLCFRSHNQVSSIKANRSVTGNY